jgi:hypothetical protein
MRKELLRQITLSMAAMDPMVWSYYMSAMLEEREHQEEQIVPVVRNREARVEAERRTAA